MDLNKKTMLKPSRRVNFDKEEIVDDKDLRIKELENETERLKNSKEQEKQNFNEIVFLSLIGVNNLIKNLGFSIKGIEEEFRNNIHCVKYEISCGNEKIYIFETIMYDNHIISFCGENTIFNDINLKEKMIDCFIENGFIITKNDQYYFCAEEKEKPKFNEPWKPKNKEEYYYLYDLKYDRFKVFTNDYYDKELIQAGNYFKTSDQAEQRAKEIKVYNLLKNFSDANSGDKIDWKNNTEKYYIDTNCTGLYVADYCGRYMKILKVYFISKEVAEEALRRYRTELEEIVK